MKKLIEYLIPVIVREASRKLKDYLRMRSRRAKLKAEIERLKRARTEEEQLEATRDLAKRFERD